VLTMQPLATPLSLRIARQKRTNRVSYKTASVKSYVALMVETDHFFNTCSGADSGHDFLKIKLYLWIYRVDLGMPYKNTEINSPIKKRYLLN